MPLPSGINYTIIIGNRLLVQHYNGQTFSQEHFKGKYVKYEWHSNIPLI